MDWRSRFRRWLGIVEATPSGEMVELVFSIDEFQAKMYEKDGLPFGVFDVIATNHATSTPPCRISFAMQLYQVDEVREAFGALSVELGGRIAEIAESARFE